MRTGAIFARGSCRALKWVALMGMVFALGVGQAAAQIKISDPKTVDEGDRLAITVTADVRVTGQVGETTLTVNVTNAPITAVDESKMLTPADTSPPDYVAPAATVVLNVPARTDTQGYTEHTLTHTLTVQTNSDSDAEDEGVVFTFTPVAPTETGVGPKGGGANTTWSETAIVRNVTINDTDDQNFIWEVKSPAKPNEAMPIIVELKADPTPFQLSYTTTLSVDKDGYELSPSSFEFDASQDEAGEDGPMVDITITPPASDKNRDSDTIMVNAFVAGTASTRVPALEIEVADIHMLPMADKISAKAFMDDGEGKASKNEAMSVMEGADPVHVTVTVDRGTTGYPKDEALEVSVMADSSQALDYRVDPAKITIASGQGEKKATFKLWALEDDDVGAEDLMLMLTAKGAKEKDNGPGEVMQMFSIAIEDDTTAKVWAKDGAMDAVYGARDAAAGDDEKINPGENFDIMTDDLFGHLPTVTVDYAASSNNSAVGVSASGEKIMVMPQDMEGTAMITITATATDMASSFKTSQTRSDVARIMFEVDVMLAALTYTVMPPEDMNLVEGGESAMVKVMTSRPLDGDETAEIMLMRDGSSSATMDDVTITPEMVMLEAGDEMAEFTVMAVEDEMPDGGVGMPEMLTLFPVVNDMQMTDHSVMFYIWDMAVPALPIIAQLLLGGLLAVGGFRRYRRRS